MAVSVASGCCQYPSRMVLLRASISPSALIESSVPRAGAPALGTELSISADGEILARSNTILEGYWQQPEATETAMADGWFHTGDGGFLDDERHLQILDRKKG